MSLDQSLTPDTRIHNINLALNRPATQSSTSPWSTSPIPEVDAGIANNGDLLTEQVFHTERELYPWWQVDLEDFFLISKVIIFNRNHCAERLRHFTLLRSTNGHQWLPFFTKSDHTVFGKEDDEPYVADANADCLARFVRVRLDGRECLHFRECQVFGDHSDPAVRERLMEADDRTRRERHAMPEGRSGHVTEIERFAVFVDNDNYISNIRTSIDEGRYEGRERRLVRNFVLPSDRVIEVGTAIGIVSMTAASIVGASNVLTFDANKDIVADAKENFRRNGLSDIKAVVGILKNKYGILKPNDTVDFYIDEAFWASRLNASSSTPGIIKTVKIPVFCLEDEIVSHKANVLICDIEGGEVELLMRADLLGIRLIIMETHYWSAGESATDAMVRKLVVDGFLLHLGESGGHMVVFRR